MSETPSLKMGVLEVDFATVLIIVLFLIVFYRAVRRLSSVYYRPRVYRMGESIPPSVALEPAVVLGTVSKLFIYPIKSCGPVEVSSAELTRLGFKLDRTMMVIKDNNFVSMRQLPLMGQIKIEIDDDELILSCSTMAKTLRVGAPTGEFLEATLWSTPMRCQLVSAEADEWFSACLGQSLRLVRLLHDHHRPVPIQYAVRGCVNQASFADAFPLLLAAERSVEALSAEAGHPVNVLRFRPNIVLGNSESPAWDEDYWGTLEVGPQALRLHAVKACDRCKIPKVDPRTGSIDDEAQPHGWLQRQGRMIRSLKQIYFGVNLLHDADALFQSIRVGDQVKLVRRYKETTMQEKYVIKR